jgi:ribosomal protein S11
MNKQNSTPTAAQQAAQQAASWQQECAERGLYSGRELQPYQGRPGAMQAYALPSLNNGASVPRTAPICEPTTKKQ